MNDGNRAMETLNSGNARKNGKPAAVLIVTR
jgi:hypothetical protein